MSQAVTSSNPPVRKDMGNHVLRHRQKAAPSEIQNKKRCAMRVWMVAGACFVAIHNALGSSLARRWTLPKNGRRPRL
jgi:hypothetical protein